MLLGDDTAKHDGRISLNPLKHIDPIGVLCMAVVGFGWAKPVRFNIGKLKHGKGDVAITAFAGPLSNIALAFFFAIIYCSLYGAFSYDGAAGIVLTIVNQFVITNIALAVFNMLPIPPLDGSKVFLSLLPDKLYYKMLYIGNAGMIVLLALIFFGVVDKILTPPVIAIYEAFYAIGDIICAPFS
jgi:Zn-dependent protease